MRKAWAIVRKDLALERRSREMLGSMFLFSLLVLLIFSFSFDLRIEQPQPAVGQGGRPLDHQHRLEELPPRRLRRTGKFSIARAASSFV